MTVGGPLSEDPIANPDFAYYNHVVLPYCDGARYRWITFVSITLRILIAIVNMLSLISFYSLVSFFVH